MLDHFKWALVGPTKTYITMNCPSSDADVKSELDAQALVSFLFLLQQVSSYGGIRYIRHPGQSYARDVVNTSILRT